MASLNVKTEYSEYKDCKLRVGKYVEDNSVAVEIYNRWDGPIARVTTCLCDHSLSEDEAYVDTNNCPLGGSSSGRKRICGENRAYSEKRLLRISGNEIRQKQDGRV